MFLVSKGLYDGIVGAGGVLICFLLYLLFHHIGSKLKSWKNRVEDEKINENPQKYVDPSFKVELLEVKQQAENSDTKTIKQIHLKGVVLNFIKVKGGSFIMGATNEQDLNTKSECNHPHRVTLSEFYIGETEVTQEIWTCVMGNYLSPYKSKKCPADGVSWKECQDFIRKLNKMTGLRFRLPTEAEWEYAARGGCKSKGFKYSGSDNINDVAWYVSNNKNKKTQEVGTKQPNELGLYDMSGNVWEWCQDRFGNYGKEDEINPIGSNTGSNRVLRGGSYGDKEEICTVTARIGIAPSSNFRNVGFRLAL